MHELSIAIGIVKIAEEACEKAKAKQVDVVELQIGELSGVEVSSLDFVWPMAVQNTKLSNAEKAIDWVDGKAKCQECGKNFDIHSLYDGCPSCHSYFKDITAGKELKVKSLVIS
jgi:hydrogenase nickel incorporation protein HypA/HybF